MADPVRPMSLPSAASAEEWRRHYRQLLDDVMRAMQEGRADVAALRGELAELREEAKLALEAGEACREQTRAMREEFRATLGCLDKLKEYVDELEEKLVRVRRAQSYTEERIEEAVAQGRLTSTGRFQAIDVQAAAERVVNERERQHLSKLDDERRGRHNTIATGVVIAIIVAVLGFAAGRIVPQASDAAHVQAH